MLHRIQISTNTCEVTMQVKRAIGKVTLHKLPIPIHAIVLSLYNILHDLLFVKALLYGFDTYI